MMTMAMFGASSRSPLPDVNMLSFCVCRNDANTNVMYIYINIVLVFHMFTCFLCCASAALTRLYRYMMARSSEYAGYVSDLPTDPHPPAAATGWMSPRKVAGRSYK